MKHGRSAEREALMQLIYQMTVTGDFSDTAENDFFERCTQDEDVNLPSGSSYVREMRPVICGHLDEIDEKISVASDNWKLSRISAVDLAILRIAICEIDYRDDIPIGVSVNEAVELAKKYSGEKSPKFINGVLRRITRDENNVEKAD